MRKQLMAMSVVLISLHSADVLAQAKSQEAVRTAVIEARLVRDSSGCPASVDIWLASTTDTIQGFEVVLQWDRPNQIQFVRGTTAAKKPTSATDSLTALLKPSDPKTQIPIDRRASLLAGWEFVEARSADGLTAKILGVAKLFGQDEPTPILPGASGSLMRLPLSILPPGGIPDSGAVNLNFDATGTRLSTLRGVLFGPLALKSLAVDPRECGKKASK